jgi:hypothetical protein
LFALLVSDAFTFNGAVLPLASIRTPTSRKDPDWVLFGFPQLTFAAFQQGNVMRMVPFAKLIVVIAVTFANNPVAPSMRIGSTDGT